MADSYTAAIRAAIDALEKVESADSIARLLRIELREEQVAHARTASNLADARLKIARAELALSQAASQRGDNTPTTIEERPLREWLGLRAG